MYFQRSCSRTSLDKAPGSEKERGEDWETKNADMLIPNHNSRSFSEGGTVYDDEYELGI